MSDIFDTSSEEIDKNDPAIKRLVEKSEVLLNHEDLVQDLERNLNEAKQFVRKLKEIEIPDLMAECGLTEFTNVDGFKLNIKNFVMGSLPKEPDLKQAALQELERIGDEAVALIKTTIVITFDKKEHNYALSVAQDLRDKGMTVEVGSGVHASTLQAFGRECLKKGIQIFTEKLGLYVGKTTDVKPPKDK